MKKKRSVETKIIGYSKKAEPKWFKSLEQMFKVLFYA